MQESIITVLSPGLEKNAIGVSIVSLVIAIHLPISVTASFKQLQLLECLTYPTLRGEVCHEGTQGHLVNVTQIGLLDFRG